MAKSADSPVTVLPRDPAELTPDELAADAERTRRRLGRTISQLEYRLSPRHLAQQGLATVRQGAQEMRRNAGHQAQELRRGTATWTVDNPLPALALAFVAGFALGSARTR